MKSEHDIRSGDSLSFDQQREIIYNLSNLPHKILQHHDIDGLSQMILHELCHNNNFAIPKATYLVDNPDFDHLIGAAGFQRDECHLHKENLWEQPGSFLSDMKDATFHNDVRKFFKNSLKRQDINLDDSDEIRGLGHFMGMQNPQFFSWRMKHGNHGLLLFDHGDEELSEWKHKFLRNVAALLSLCSIS